MMNPLNIPLPDEIENIRAKCLPADPINRLYIISESLTHIACGLPEEAGGLSFLLAILGKDVHDVTAQLDTQA